MVFGTRWFHKIITETETDVDFEFSVLDTLHNILYQIIELTKNNNEPIFDEFYPFEVMMNFVQLIPLFRFIYKNSSFTKEVLELD